MSVVSHGEGPLSQWHRPDSQQQRAIAELVQAAASADGVAAFGGHVLDNLAAVAVATVHVGSGQHARLIAAVAAPERDPAELVVHPDFRRRGHGTALLRAGIAMAGKVWAHGDLPAARSLAAAERLRPVRTLLQLGRDLPLPAELARAHWPDGVSVRTFHPGADDEQFLAVNGRAFAWHPEQGRLDAAGFATEKAQSWFDPAGFFLAVAAVPTGESKGAVLGFHWTRLHRGDGGAPVGEVYVLGVDPQSPVRGLGTPLAVTGLVHLARRGAERAILYVEGDNEPALRLYRRLGFRTVGTDVVYVPAPVRTVG